MTSRQGMGVTGGTVSLCYLYILASWLYLSYAPPILLCVPFHFVIIHSEALKFVA